MLKTKRSKKGITLMELLVTMGIFALMAGSILATFKLAVGYWNSGTSQNSAEMAARLAFQAVQAELSQAVVDPTTDSGSSGYLSISPSILALQSPYNDPTGILMPNANSTQQTSQVVIFDEPADPAAFTPGSQDPANYKQIEYQISNGNTLERVVTYYNAAGGSANQKTYPAAEIKNGTLTLQATYVSAYSLDLQVSAEQNGETYTLSSFVYAPGGENQ